LQKINVSRFRSFDRFEIRNFHLTPQRKLIHPILWRIIAPVAKIFAALFGRALRKWYSGLPPNKRRYFYEWFVRNRRKFAFGGLVCGGIGAVYIYFHIEQAPVTGRWRYVALTQNQFKKAVDYEVELIMKMAEGKILSDMDQRSLSVIKCVKKLIHANQDIACVHDHAWKTFVIDDDNTINAFVTPTGKIFVFTGILKTFSNIDQLAIVLSHEIAHAVLEHGVEQYSFTQLIDFAMIVALAAIWTIIPSNGIALVTSWFFNHLFNLSMQLPYSRKLETEADEVGLQLAAKACYDVREAYAYWADMSTRELTQGAMPIPDFISSHPNHSTRAQRLDLYVPEAMEIRKKCDCPPLSHRDPRDLADYRKRIVEERRALKGLI